MKKLAMYETEHFYLRPLLESDWNGEYPEWFHDHQTTKYNSHGIYPLSQNDFNQYLYDAKCKGDIVLAIVTNGHYDEKVGRVEEMHIGNISLQNIHPINHTAEIAWIIGRDHQGKGYGYHAGLIMLYHAFMRMNVNKVWLGCRADNVGMIKLAGKLGFELEATLNEEVYFNGMYMSVQRWYKGYYDYRDSRQATEVKTLIGVNADAE